MASGAGKRYAQAVFGLARESGRFDQWQEELGRLNELVSDPQASVFLGSPNIAETKKIELLDATLAESQPEARNLARLLLQRHRLGIIPEIYQIFQDEVLAERGIAVADVTTAEALDEQGQAIVKERLKKLIGKDIELRMSTDPAMIGGIVARVGDQLIDGSVVSQLRRLRNRLAASA
jgi:F-type H+-transporting ATPase subunit delta